MDFETMGEEVLGDEWSTVGAAPALRGGVRSAVPAGGRMLRMPPRPEWRGAIAPGVPMPGQGLELLPLTNPAGAPTFTSAIAAFNMEARPQRPFRSERLLVTVRRNGASAAGLIVVCTGIFIGTQLQQLELGNFDIEFFGPTAFGVRLDLISATPGMLVRLPLQLQGGVLAGADTISVSMVFLGRSIR